MAMSNKDVTIVINDVSDQKSKASSLPAFKKAGISQFAKSHTETGTLYFIDVKSKK